MRDACSEMSLHNFKLGKIECQSNFGPIKWQLSKVEMVQIRCTAISENRSTNLSRFLCLCIRVLNLTVSQKWVDGFPQEKGEL